jgi:serine/threonine protein kinase
VKLGDLKLLRKIGRGTFGRVWLVQERRSGRQFALKVMEKARVIAKRSVKAVLTERSILGKLSQQPPDCIVPIEAAFQNTTSLFLLMTYIPGGDLRHYLNHRHRLTITELHISTPPNMQSTSSANSSTL